MTKARKQSLRCACLLALASLLFGACGGNGAGAQQTNAPNNQSANRSEATTSGTAAGEGCAAMTDEVSAITGLKLRRQPLELRDPNEGVLRSCTWTEEGGALHAFELRKELASKYNDELDKYRNAFPERFKQLEGFADKAYVSPMAVEGWTACALRGSETFRVEIMGDDTTAEQATKLLRLALNRF